MGRCTEKGRWCGQVEWFLMVFFLMLFFFCCPFLFLQKTKGKWNEGLPEKGKLCSPDGKRTFDGRFLNGKKNGFGVMVYADGSKYEVRGEKRGEKGEKYQTLTKKPSQLTQRDVGG